MKTRWGVSVLAAALVLSLATLSPTLASAFSGGGHRWGAEAAARVFGAGKNPPKDLCRPCKLPGEKLYRYWPDDPAHSETWTNYIELGVEDICRNPRYGIGIMPQLRDYVWWHFADKNCIDTECGTRYRIQHHLWEWLIEGAVQMDYVYGDLGTLNHFWFSEEGLHEFPNDTYDNDNAWEKAEEMWVRAIDFWQEGNLGAAYTVLGYTMHLVQDMGQPAHANEDMHGPANRDSLEEWMDEPWCRGNFSAGKDLRPAPQDAGPTFPPPLLKGIGNPPANVPHHWLTDGEIVGTLGYWEYADEVVDDDYFTDGALIAHYEMPQLFEVMYMMQQIGSFFASDDEDGDWDEPLGWLYNNNVSFYGFPTHPWLYDVEEDEYVAAWDADGLDGGDDNDGCSCDPVDYDLSQHIFPWGYGAAFNASKFVLDLFRKTVDRVPPVTTYRLTNESGSVLDPGRRWFLQPVVVTLSAATDQANPGFRPSGLWKLWGLVDGAWADKSDASGLTWTIWNEGDHLVQLMSTDLMGNVEQTDVHVGVDLSPPLLQALGMKPVFDFGQRASLAGQTHLTIAWTANDSISGVASTSARLDGQPVTSGQVITLRDLGIGAHTLSLAAVDRAGNQVSQDYRFQVTYKPNCGNGTIQTGEACDDGNVTDGDGCDSNCTPSACGNGITTIGEQCDGTANCTAGCTCGTSYAPDPLNRGFCVPVVCGDGRREWIEECDDGNASNGDGCSSICSVQFGYTCSFVVAHDVCTTVCGDGIKTGTEACDDGNQVSGDGCDSDCTATACGNGIKAGTEACDDGNQIDGDGCDADCTATACGNGTLTAGEVCDDGNSTSGDGCDSNCSVTACGNGIITAGELCDDGNQTNGDGCDWDCTPTVCGSDPDNNTRWRTTPLGGCGRTAAAVDCSGDVDFYSFTAPSSGAYTLATTPAGSTSVALYDTSGNVLDQQATGVTRQLVAGQNLVVRVAAATTGRTFAYNLDINGCGAPPPPEYDYDVATTATKLGGTAGTNWVSDLAVLNPGSLTATVTVAVWLRDQANPDPQHQTLVLLAGELRKETDVLSSLFGLGPSAASLHLHSDQPLVVAARTYNQTANGTYGQFIAGVPSSGLLQAGTTAYLHGLAESVNYRTNVGFLNPTASESRIGVRFWSSDGTPIGKITTFEVPPFGSLQSNRVLASMTTSEVVGGWASVTCDHGQFLAFASVVDNRTGDPVYRPATSAPAEPVDVVLSSAANLTGAAGTYWVTDVTALNVRSGDQTVRFRLWLRDADNSAPAERSFVIKGGDLLGVGDVVSRMFDSPGAAGALEVIGTPGLLVGARTYNLVENGTYGQYIPAVDAGDAISGTAHGYLVMTTQNDAYRTNLGLVNIDSQPADVLVRLRDTRGAQVGGTKTYHLTARGVSQVNRVVEQFTTQKLSAAYLELEISPSTPNGRVHAYGSVVDAHTGDPIYERVRVVGSSEP